MAVLNEVNAGATGLSLSDPNTSIDLCSFLATDMVFADGGQRQSGQTFAATVCADREQKLTNLLGKMPAGWLG